MKSWLMLGALSLGACAVSTRGGPPGTDVRSRIQWEEDQANAVSKTTTTGAARVAPGSAIEQISAERCAQRQACNEKTTSSSNPCVDDESNQLRTRLAQRAECIAGVDAKELKECIAAIRSETCGDGFSQIERLAACSASDLCGGTATF